MHACMHACICAGMYNDNDNDNDYDNCNSVCFGVRPPTDTVTSPLRSTVTVTQRN